jgi:hypothetical protein
MISGGHNQGKKLTFKVEKAKVLKIYTWRPRADIAEIVSPGKGGSASILNIGIVVNDQTLD